MKDLVQIKWTDFKFEESNNEHYERLERNPHWEWSEHIYGLTPGKVEVMRRVIRIRLEDQLLNRPWMDRDNFKWRADCPYWMADLSIEELLDHLSVKLINRWFYPK
jgi:hypothetical protein